MAKRTVGWLWLAGSLVAALLLQGCREEEQSRPLFYDKGNYQGQADQPLTERQVDALRFRAHGQKF